MLPIPKYISFDSPEKKIAVYDTGETNKPVLFFIHGLSLNGTIWQQTMNSFAGRHRCIAVDLPGHGLSWQTRGSFTMSFYAESIRQLIETMKLNDITLIGHSMGGQISIILSLQIPAIVQRLVLVCAAGIETFTTEGGAQIIQGAELFYRAPADLSHLNAFYQPQFGNHAERLSILLENHIRQQKENFSAFSEMMLGSIRGMVNEPVHHFLQHIHQPALVLYGESDKLIPNKWVNPKITIQDIAGEAKKNLRHSTVKLIADCGHYLPIENPAAVANAIEEFCK